MPTHMEHVGMVLSAVTSTFEAGTPTNEELEAAISDLEEQEKLYSGAEAAVLVEAQTYLRTELNRPVVVGKISKGESDVK